ncbi:peptidoglycan glycosyltransferase FtsW [Bifidobacterium bohemicum]|uniref:peptidoglycan glycosyltransferase FtsW n=1 Tax=Bifidobacterium bohemicum TaxID=638617 RepID=UPI0009DD2773|nr:putative peptidoglycan glycosyltransferase FtsW [Bifidobacterium bohemicum]
MAERQPRRTSGKGRSVSKRQSDGHGAKKRAVRNARRVQSPRRSGAQAVVSERRSRHDSSSSITGGKVDVARNGKTRAQISAKGVSGIDSVRGSGIHALVNPLVCYYAFRICVLALTCFGVIMVFSSSTVTMVSNGLSPWMNALRQFSYCVVGLLLGFGATQLDVKYYRKLALVFMIGSILLQLVTMTPLGVSVGGNTGWIGIGGVTIQPAEILKLALCIWMPLELSRARELSERAGSSASSAGAEKSAGTVVFDRDVLKIYALLVVVFVASLAAVMFGHDLGTAMILLLIGAVAFITSGFPIRILGMVAVAMVAAVAFFVVKSPNRMNRIVAAYKPCDPESSQSLCYQSIHSKYAMASGGLFGVGIGNSREKWNYLPAAHNDFIFAIIGEEMGFIGAVVVILLFIVIGWCMIVVAVKSTDRYASMVLMCITIWIVGQAVINIMVVVGLLPVMGVPLPFVSAGGSSLVMCLAAAGAASAMMRLQPQVAISVPRLA